MRPLIRLSAIAATSLVLATGCTATPRGEADTARAGFGTAPTPAAPTQAAVPEGRAPERPYAVGIRTLQLTNGPARPLPTTLYYPATGASGRTPKANAAPADGRFPIVVFSHGLMGVPVAYQGLLSRWAAAGFVVVAPAYPHTSFGVAQFSALDVLNQPKDASAALTAVLALDRTPGDPLRGRLATAQVGAAGHSGGGITTVGLFTGTRDARLTAGIVLAGNGLGVGDAYHGSPARLLFVHGAQDNVVPIALGRTAYQHAPWPKAFLTLPGEGHTDPYVDTRDDAFEAVADTTTDFLRYALYGDQDAKDRLPGDVAGQGQLENRL